MGDGGGSQDLEVAWPGAAALSGDLRTVPLGVGATSPLTSAPVPRLLAAALTLHGASERICARGLRTLGDALCCPGRRWGRGRGFLGTVSRPRG